MNKKTSTKLITSKKNAKHVIPSNWVDYVGKKQKKGFLHFPCNNDSNP